MKKGMKWWQIAGLIIDLAGAVFLVFSIASDSSDQWYLIVAMSCILIANALQLVFNIRENKKQR